MKYQNLSHFYLKRKLELSRIRLEQQLDGLDATDNSLREKFVQTQTTEKEFLDGITKKYGEGTLDQESGVFIPNKLSQVNK